LNTLYDEGLLADGFMLEFLKSHSSVIYQPPYNSNWFGGINPYTLGFSMWRDIRRICEEPTDEDRSWFPDLAGSDWHESLDFAMRNFKDESFVAQYLSPKLMRDLRLFTIEDDDREPRLRVAAIHDDAGYRDLRQQLSEQYNLGSREPDLQVWDVDFRGDRTLTIRYTPHERRPLGDNIESVMDHLAYLWGFVVRLESVGPDGVVELLRTCQHEKRHRG
jgi:stage V sporulation protein R